MPMKQSLDRHFCVAPMMGYTDRHFRYLLRLISKRAMLYTEMISSRAIVYGNRSKLLGFSEQEHPLALQVGGSDPAELARCALTAEQWGYDEININVGCPSARVSSGCFGVQLMKTPQIVADCVAAMRQASRLPISVKCRIGVDQQDSYHEFKEFIACVAAAGCKIFIIHARKAWLGRLSPRANRTVPPLNYQYVYDLKQDFPDLTLILNGGLDSLENATEKIKTLDGVMLGRAVRKNPLLLKHVDRYFYNDMNKPATAIGVAQKMLRYIEQQLSEHGLGKRQLLKHLQNLFRGQRGARHWRQCLSEEAPYLGNNQLINLLETNLNRISSQNWEDFNYG